MLIGYARASKSERQDAATQVDALKAAGCAKIFEETFSGGRWDRPQFNRMLDELHSDDVVIVSGLDHLASSLVDLIPTIDKVLRRGAKIRSLSEPIEISGPSAQIISVLAKFDRDQLKQRTGDGQKAARANGKGGGRSPKLSPAQQREIIDMLSAGRSAADLARLFRVHRATIGRFAAKVQRTDNQAAPNVR